MLSSKLIFILLSGISTGVCNFIIFCLFVRKSYFSMDSITERLAFLTLASSIFRTLRS